ncbi:MAG: hypothetical protein ACRBCL_03050 [Maritimibacter sp.]
MAGFSEGKGFASLEFNEAGDYLAGRVGPLATSLEVLTQTHQGQTLRDSATALEQQTKAPESQHALLQKSALLQAERWIIKALKEIVSENGKHTKDLHPRVGLIR